MAVKECCEKLSPNKKSIFGLRMWSQILYLLLASCLLGITSAADSEGTCANVKTIFEKNGMLTVIDLQAQPNSDANQLCLSKGCCGSGARDRLTQAARTQLESALWSELSKLADTFTNRAIKFDEFFRRLLKQSREDFHNMFKRTYGIIYEQHSYLFEELFEKVERYYTRGDLDFDLMMDGFFGILYNKMFIVLNSQYAFDEKYITCLNEHMREIQPFADVPNKLSAQLRRAMVATRTFHKALRSAADVIRSMMQMQVTTECVTAWTRLRYCGSCSGYQPPACSRYCHNVIRGCLPAHADLGVHWEAFLDAADKVSDRLLGPFNIAMVVEPLNIKVSEAIMSFQERNGEISQQIFTVCGKPVLSSSGGVSPFFTPGKQRRSVRSIPDFDWPQKDDDFEIEASFESLMNNDPSLAELRSPESIRKVTEEMAEQAKLRERFLQYMRGHIDLEEYEEHERRKREAQPEPVAPGPIDIEYKPLAFGGKKSPKKKKTSPVKYDDSRAGSDWAGPALEKLVHETQGRIRNTRHYWNHLPALLCTTTSVTSSPCFNGSAIGSYIPLAAGEGSAGLPSNPEVRGVPGASSTTQSATLRALAGKLNDAYNGLEVQWVEDANSDLHASSSFHRDLVDDVESGSGSGDYNNGDGLPDDDEDRQNGFDTGSGFSPTDEDQTEPEPDFEPHTEPQPPPPSPTVATSAPTPASTPVPPPPPIITEAPFTPRVIEPPLTKNVQISVGNVDIPLPETDTDSEESDDVEDSDQSRIQSPGNVQPVAGGADRPSLHVALITYALPVVCAWFGTIVTDLF